MNDQHPQQIQNKKKEGQSTNDIIVSRLYENLRNEVLRENRARELFLKATDFGFFAWSMYPGAYADKGIEDKLQNACLPAVDETVEPEGEHYIHIASKLFEVGGHSRCIWHFIDKLSNARHTVILTDQKKDIPSNLSAFFQKSGTEVIKIGAGSDPINRAEALRNHVIKLKPSAILLFTHPNDLVPMIAFGNFKPCRICLYNHADHTFWYGGKWIDTIIDFREDGIEITRKARFRNDAVLLRLPLISSYQSDSRDMAKRKLGYSAKDRIIGTLTNFTKVNSPYKQTNFVELLSEWAAHHPEMKFVVIGLTANQFRQLLKKDKIGHNITCLGIVADPEAYYQAFDFFVDPFPLGTGLGLIEACKYGAIPVFSPHPTRFTTPFQVFHESIQKLYSQPADLDDLRKNFGELAGMDDEKRALLSVKTKDLIHEHHRGANWVKAFQASLSKEKYHQEISSKVDPDAEAAYFRDYVKKDQNDLFEFLVKLRHLVNRKIIWSFFFGKYKVFQLQRLTWKSWKLLAWRTIRSIN